MRIAPPLLVCFALLALASSPARSRAAFVWVEAESAKDKKLFPNPSWWDAVRADGLSGGARAASFAEAGQETGYAVCPFTIPEAGKYTLWVRLAGSGTGYAWTLDGGGRQELDIKAIKAADNDARRKRKKNEPEAEPRYTDERNLALDGGTDARYHAWVRLAELEMAKGGHAIRWELGGSAGEKRFGAVDCFVLTTEPFTPNGQFKPGETNPNLVVQNPDEMWAFKPAPDPLSQDAVLDLRHLNEETAGQHGFIGLSKDRMSFVRGDGKPIRFWGGTDYNQRDLDLEALKKHGEFLAKRGVNIARWHGHLPANPDRKEKAAGKTTRLTDINEKELDEAFKLVAGMKEAGIYTILSPYWGSHTTREPDWTLPDAGVDNLSAQVFFVPEVQAAYKGWLKALYTRPNPYTGVPLKDDPAVAIIQLQNEDSMLFWTMQRVKGEAERILRRNFAEWLKKKYGAAARAREAWKDYPCQGDDWDHGLPALFMVWEFTTDAWKEKGAQPGFKERRADQLNFFGETMHAFNREIGRYLREDLGCKQLVNAGNWKTVDPVLVEDVERWSYTANEVIGKNHYFGGLHTGRTKGYQILADNIFTGLSAAREPRKLPTFVRQPVGHPFIISESLWVPPNPFEAEGPLLVAAHQCLTGLDIFFWFANGAPEWAEAVRGGSLPKWTFATPMQLGQFPAAALLFRSGYLREGEPVVVENRSLAQLWDGTTPLTSETASFDPNRDAGNAAKEVNLESPVDPLAFLVGPVHVAYGADPAKTRVEDLKPFLDHDKKTAVSNTGELAADLGRGLFLVRAPKAQGAAGFFEKAGPVDLGDVRIECRNGHASLVAVALDDKPLASSAKILVQAGTWQRPDGWETEKVRLEIDGKPVDAQRIVRVGREPWMVRKTDATVSVRNKGAARITVLDPNGMATGTVAGKRDGEWLRFAFPPDALYAVLEP